jgi:hypothetical protein
MFPRAGEAAQVAVYAAMGDKAMESGRSCSPGHRVTTPYAVVFFVIAIDVPPRGVDVVCMVIAKVRREKGPPASDLFEPLRAGTCHRQDGYPRGAEALPAWKLHVVLAVAGL